MNEFFLKVLNMSISASWIILVVLILRLLLKKAPKWINVLLWGIVAVRLICPFTIESAMSLMPSTETISSKNLTGTSKNPADASQTSNDTSKDISDMSQTITDTSQDKNNSSQNINNSSQNINNSIHDGSNSSQDINNSLHNGTNSSQGITNSTHDGSNSSQDITDTQNINTSSPAINNTTNPTTQKSTISTANDEDINVLLSLTSIFSKVWIAGIILMVTYSAISYIRLKNKIGTAILLRNNIYQSESVVSPFVLGIIKPKIYLPFNLSDQDIEPVIAHEQAHIKRKDYLWKPLGFIVLTLHWFNPLVWLGYILLCRDIELACDEKAIKDMTISQRADYSQALLTCSVNRRMIAACPIAFGEVNVKSRIKSVLNYKKPTFWLILISIIASIIVAICFLTNPVSKTKNNKNDATTEQPSDKATSTDIDDLKAKYPTYFGLDTTKGLTVYIWQMAEDSYSCGLLANSNIGPFLQEQLDLQNAPTTLDEMRSIIAYYYPENAQEHVTVCPIVMPISSYAYVIDSSYTAKLNALFWRYSTEIKQPTEQTTSNKTTLSADDERYDFIRENYNINGNTHPLLIDVLLRNAEFIDTDNDDKLTKLSEYKLMDGSDYTLMFYSVLDVDKDGYNEVFVRQNNGTYAVFRYDHNQVYSYQISSDSFLNVDGLMSENNTYFIPKFTTSGYTKRVLAHYVENSEEDIFYVGDKMVSRDTYIEYTTGNANERNAYKFYVITDLDYFPIAEERFTPKFVTDYKLESYVPQEIVEVLLYDKEFIYNSEYYNADDDNVVKVTKMSDFKDIYGSNPEAIRRIDKFVVADINQDGYSEVVVYMKYPGDDVIVFHSENGIVYGYNFVFRAAKDIAPSGYLYGSSGAADNDTYTIIFNKDKYTTKERCGTDSDGTYYVDEVEVSREEYLTVSDEVWGKGELQEYETVLILLELLENKQPTEQTTTPDKPTEQQSTEETTEKIEPLIPEVIDKSTFKPNGKTPQLLKDVVLSKAEFTFVETELVHAENHDITSKKISERPMLLSKYNYFVNYFDDEVMHIDAYHVYDLDEDGYNEIILHNPGGWLILHYEDNKVYGFRYFERGMNGIYSSGMFGGSGGASYGTFSTMSFDKDSFKVTHHAIWDDGKVTIEGKETTQDEYWKYLHSGKFDYLIPYFKDLKEILDIE